MSKLSKANPVTGERLVLLQPAMLESADHICAARADLTHALREALKSGALALGSSAMVLREFFEGADAVAFMLPGGLIVGRVTDSAAVKQAHADTHGTGRIVRPGVYR